MLKKKAFKIGRIIKTHGVQGQLSVASELKLSEPFEWPEWVFLDIDNGLVPFRTNPDEMIWRDHKHLIIAFSEYDKQDDVTRFIGYDVWFPDEYQSIIVGSETAEYPFLGFTLMDSSGNELGIIEEYIDVPSNPLFKLTVNYEEVLIPAREEWIVELDEPGKQIIMDLPDGLVDLSSP